MRLAKSNICALFCLLPLLYGAVAFAQPQVLTDPPGVEVVLSANVSVRGDSHDGEVGIKAAIVNGANDTVWSNDGSSQSGSEPTSDFSTRARDGKVTITLGSNAMDPLPSAVFDGRSRLYLVLWLDAGHGFEKFEQIPFSFAPRAASADRLGGFSAQEYLTIYSDLNIDGGDIVGQINSESLAAFSNQNNSFTLGDGADSLYKSIIADTSAGQNPQLRYNTDSRTWQFSNDGATFSDIGSSVSEEFVGPGSQTSAVDLGTAEVAGVLPLNKGGTGASTAVLARDSLGLEIGVDVAQFVLNNFLATRAPAVSDDTAAGFSIGSLWLDQNTRQLYIAAVVTAGAAVWEPLAAVGTASLEDGSVTTAKLADDSVTAAKIVDRTIAATDIAADSLTSGELAADAVGASELSSSGVSAGSYTAASFTVDADGRITAASSNALSSGDMTAVGDATSGDAFVDGTNNGSRLVYEGSSVDGFETILTFSGNPIADSTVTIPNITGTLVTTGDTDTVTAAMLANDSVDGAEIATDAIGSSEIAADAIGSSEIAADAVGSSEVAADAIGASELASTAVTPGSYSMPTITIDADGRITSASSNAPGSGDVTAVGDATSGDAFVDGTNNGTRLIYEGATVDGFETALAFSGNPTGDSTVTIPNRTGTIITSGDTDTVTATMLAADSVASSEIAADAVGSAEVAADAVGASELASTTVVAGSYTLASFTVDADGRITTASSNAETGDISAVGNATSGAAFTDGANNGTQLIYEGTTIDTFENTLTFSGNPTADTTVTIPNTTGTLVTTGDSGTVTSTMIANATVADADISATAAIAYSKLAALTSGNILVGNASNVATSVAMSGDATISNAGVVTVADNSVDGTDIALTGNVQGDIMYYNGTDWVRLAPGTSGQLLQTNGAAANPSWATASGDMTAVGNATSGAAFTDGANNGTQLIYEGTTIDTFENTLTFSGNPTADTTVTIPNTTGTLVTTGDSGTVTSTMITNATIADADIANATITGAKLVNDTVTATQIGVGAVTTSEILDATVANGDIANATITGAKLANDTVTATQIGVGAVTTSEILDATVANGDISATAAIAYSKLAALTSGNILVGNASNVATSVAMSGDATISNAGVVTVADNSVDGTDIALTGNVQGDIMYYNGTDWVRLAPGTSGQLLQTNGAAANPSWATASGDMTAVGNATSGAAFTDGANNGTQLIYEGTTIDTFENTLTFSGNPTADTTVTIPNTTGTLVTTGDSGTVTSTMITNATIADADIANATITGAKLVNDTVTATQIGVGAVTTSEILDATVANGDIANATITGAKLANDTVTATQIGVGAVTTSEILDATVANGDISATAAIAYSKLAALTSGNILVGNASNVATSVAMSGDATISNAGVVTVADNSVDGTDIALTGNVQGDIMYYNGTDWVRLAPGTSGQLLQTNGAAANPSWATASGDMTAVGNATSGAAFTDGANNGTQLIYEGTTIDTFENTLTFSGNPTADTTVTIPNTTGTLVTTGDSGTVTSTMITNATIADADIANATITGAKLVNDTVTATQIGVGAVTTSEILDATVANGDISATAAIAYSKLAALTSGNILVGNASNVATSVAMSGDATISNAGVVTVADNSVDGTDIALTGNVQGDIMYYNGTDWVRLAPGTSGQLLQTNGAAANPSWATASGDMTAVGNATSGAAFTDGANNGTQLIYEGTTIDTFENTLTFSGNPTADTTVTIPNTTGTLVTTGDSGTVTSTMITNATVADADISATAAIAYSKLAALTSGNILVGNASNVATSVAMSGDATISNAGAVTIADNAVDGTDIAIGGDVAGDLLYYNGTDWSRLSAGSSGNVLTSNGGGLAPSWSLPGAGYGAADVSHPVFGRRMGYAFPLTTAITTFTAVGMTAPTLATGHTATSQAALPGSARKFIRYASAATNGNQAGIVGPLTETEALYVPRYSTVLKTDSVIDTRRIWVGLTSATLAAVSTNTTGTPATALSFMAVGYDTAGTGNTTDWLCCSGNSVNYSCVTTGVAVSVTTEYLISVEAPDNTQVLCTVNGTTISKTTHLPVQTTAIGPYNALTTLSAAARNHFIAKYSLEQN